MKREFKVISIHHRWKSRGEWNEERKQYLKEKVYRSFTFFGLLKPFYWRTVDVETVPSFAWLHHAIFGDRPDWDSKFKNIPNCSWGEAK